LTSKVKFGELVIAGSRWSSEFDGGERDGEIVRKERKLLEKYGKKKQIHC